MSPEIILERYNFDADTGVFFKKRTSGDSRTGIVKTPKGYLRVFVAGRYYMAHHLVWFMSNGSLPESQIDHINGNPADNRLINLRQVTPVENSQNQRRAHATSSTGLLGASPVRNPRLKSELWRAQIKVNGKSVHLGLFKSPEKAHLAYIEAKRRMHPGCTV